MGDDGVTILTFLIGGGTSVHHDRRPARRGGGAHRLSRGLSDARAGGVLQGGADARLPRGCDCRRDRRVGVGRAAHDDHADRPISGHHVLPVSLVLSGLVFAGAGGVNNLAQSNWIRDKGFGMGVYIPRIVSPITGEEVAAPATGSMMRQDAENLRRFRGWWAVANKEQLVSFWFICVFSITIFSMLAYSTVYGRNISGEANLAFIRAEGEALKPSSPPGSVRSSDLRRPLAGAGGAGRPGLHLPHRRRRPQDGVPAGQSALDGEPHLLLVVGARSPRAPHPAVRLQPAAVPAGRLRLPERHGDVRLLDSLIQLNRRGLPPALRVRGLRLGMLVFATVFYGFFSGWLVLVHVRSYLAEL